MNTYSKNVPIAIGINCPFDVEYLPMLRPLLFTILYHGFEPRIALEDSDSGLPRIQKITKLIHDSKYSIHDLSRMQATKIDELYRLNMPFELGIDFGYRCIGVHHKDKKFLILETEQHRYMKAISDINGLDIKLHKNDPQEIVSALRNWFVETAQFKNAKSPTMIWYDFNDFYSQLYDDKRSEGFTKNEIEFMPIPELIENMKSWLKII